MALHLSLEEPQRPVEGVKVILLSRSIQPQHPLPWSSHRSVARRKANKSKTSRPLENRLTQVSINPREGVVNPRGRLQITITVLPSHFAGSLGSSAEVWCNCFIKDNLAPLQLRVNATVYGLQVRAPLKLMSAS